MFGFTQIESISTTELAKKLQQEKLNLLDVREIEEYRIGHIKNAQNVPLSMILTFSAPKGSLFYVICQSGIRSKRACKILKKAGYDVINVRGGMSSWTGRGVKDG